ncbi:MAG: molybdopterin-dependent oxidoreductase [Xanthomonadales bacterium]|nr:molybdopterin-dependent oxidoreductase [Gammaproteobacteria bacterium]NNK05066.1 molybdopterin-dependent oxidoreductase [Xanthomonadales bacterium]
MQNMTGKRTHHIACNLCEAICGLEIKTDNGEIQSIRGDKQDPLSKGHICPKAVALQDIYKDPDRLRTPLKKTADGWREITWTEAFDEVSNRLKNIQRAHGNNAVAVYLGNPTVHNLEALIYGPMFFRTLKIRNRYSATSVDQLPEQLVSLMMFGHSLLIPLPDLDRTRFHIIFGANPVVSNGSMMTAPGVTRRLKAIRQRGGKLVVIDPRRTETAALADQHLFIRPGSDVYMLLAMLNVVFSEGLQTLGSASEFTAGLEHVESFVKDFQPESVASKTGIDPQAVRSLVREFCQAEGASCYGRIGVSTQRHGTLTQWLITVFNIVTGNLDIPGGTMFSQPAFEILKAAPPGKKGFADHYSRVRNLPNFNGEFPVAALAGEITTTGEGQVRALITNAGNPVLSTPNGQRLDEALGELEFMVSIDIYLNETSRHADIILPPVMGLERPHYDVAFQALAIRNGAKFSPAVFTPGREQRSDLQIFTELAWRMQKGNMFSKLGGWFKKVTLQRLGSGWIIDRRLKQGPYAKSHNLTLKKLKQNPHGIDLGAMRPCLPGRLFTRDKTIKLAPAGFVAELKQLGNVTPADHADPVANGFDLQLIGRRDPRTNNSWLHNSRRMVKGKQRCIALIHPQDAESRGLESGDMAQVSSRVGSIRIPVQINADIMPGVISIPHGWGHQVEGIKLSVASEHAGVNTNILTDDHFLDSVSGNAALNGVPVSLSKVN